MTHTLLLPITLLSKNQRDKLHWRQRHALRLSYGNIIGLKYPRRHPTPDCLQSVVVTRLLGPRERDFDLSNLPAGSAVELLDAFTHLGWWHDDSPKWLKPYFEQTRSKRQPGPACIVEIQAQP